MTKAGEQVGEGVSGRAEGNAKHITFCHRLSHVMDSVGAAMRGIKTLSFTMSPYPFLP